MGAAAAAEGASVIATPAHERAVATPGDAAFIKGSDESDTPVSGGQVTDGDWEPSDEESIDSDYDRRHALVVRRSLEEVVESDEGKPEGSTGSESEGMGGAPYPAPYGPPLHTTIPKHYKPPKEKQKKKSKERTKGKKRTKEKRTKKSKRHVPKKHPPRSPSKPKKKKKKKEKKKSQKERRHHRKKHKHRRNH